MTSPTTQKASLGRIVHYRLSEEDAIQINRRRADAIASLQAGKKFIGEQLHIGNDVQAGDIAPALIVKVWSDFLVNLKVELDGTDVLWATSRTLEDSATTGGTWHWPPRV